MEVQPKLGQKYWDAEQQKSVYSDDFPIHLLAYALPFAVNHVIWLHLLL